MNNRTKAMLIWSGLLAALVFAPVVLAQGEGPGAGAVDWVQYLALAINTIVVPIATKLLKPLWAMVPSWLKTFVPLVVGSVIMIAQSAFLEWGGHPIDLGMLNEIFVGAVSGVPATIAYKMGKGSTSN